MSKSPVLSLRGSVDVVDVSCETGSDTSGCCKCHRKVVLL